MNKKIILIILCFFCCLSFVEAEAVEKKGITIHLSCEGFGRVEAKPINIKIRSYPFGQYASCISNNPEITSPCQLYLFPRYAEIETTDQEYIDKFAENGAFRPGLTSPEMTHGYIDAYKAEMKYSSKEFFDWLEEDIGTEISIDNYETLVDKLESGSLSFKYVEKNKKVIIAASDSAVLPWGRCTYNRIEIEKFYVTEPEAPSVVPLPGAPNDKYGDLNTCSDIDVNKIKACGCIPAAVADITSKAYFILRIVGPILLLILGGFEMAKAIASQDESSIEKAKKKLVNKFIAAAAIFLILTIMELVVNLLAKNSAGILKCIHILLDGYVI